jgi:hypothetical protein
MGRVALAIEELEVGPHAPVAVGGGHDDPDQVVPIREGLYLVDQGPPEGVVDLVHSGGALQPERADAGLFAEIEAEVGVSVHVTPAR